MLNRTNEDAGISRTEDQAEEPSNRERREVFKRLGRYAAYTAPVVIAILVSEKGYAAPMPSPTPGPAPSPV